jgi:hypothetical protein
VEFATLTGQKNNSLRREKYEVLPNFLLQP